MGPIEAVVVREVQLLQFTRRTALRVLLFQPRREKTREEHRERSAHREVRNLSELHPRGFVLREVSCYIYVILLFYYMCLVVL